MYLRGIPFVIAVSLVMLVACSQHLVPAPQVQAVVLDVRDLSLEVGQSARLVATVQVSGDASGDVHWNSDATDVAVVDETGLVTGVTSGATTITAVSAFDPTRSAGATVTVVSVDPEPSPSTSSVTAQPNRVHANGVATSTVTVELRDAMGQLIDIDGSGLAFEPVTSGSIGDLSVAGTGTFIFTYTAGMMTGEVTLQPTLHGVALTESATVTLTVPVVGVVDGTYVELSSLEATDDGVRLDLAWPNSWRGDGIASGMSFVEAADNWDAVWIFAKARVAGTWHHVEVHGAVPHPSAAVVVPADATGAIVHRNVPGAGDLVVSGLELQAAIAPETDEVRVYAIELVYIPAGPFLAGGGADYHMWTFAPTTIDTADATVAPSGDAGFGGTPSGGFPRGLNSNTVQPTSPAWPNGYTAYYIMKHELSQGQYAAFLNTLTSHHATQRFHDGSTARYGMTRSDDGTFASATPYVAMNFISWADGAAFTDWAALRPLTELEFEKAARGPSEPDAYRTYAWGTTVIVSATHLLHAGTAHETPQPFNANVNHRYLEEFGPVRVGAFVGPTRTREEAGAGYFGALDLSGNVIERVINLGTSAGASFTGAHGDGRLFGSRADTPGWPGVDAIGSGMRGGGWRSAPSTPMLITHRNDADLARDDRVQTFGWRAARSAP